MGEGASRWAGRLAEASDETRQSARPWSQGEGALHGNGQGREPWGLRRTDPGAWGVRVSLEPRRCRISAWPRWEGSAWVRGAVGAGRRCWGPRAGPAEAGREPTSVWDVWPRPALGSNPTPTPHSLLPMPPSPKARVRTARAENNPVGISLALLECPLPGTAHKHMQGLSGGGAANAGEGAAEVLLMSGRAGRQAPGTCPQAANRVSLSVVTRVPS